MLRPVLISGTPGQNVQGILRRYETASGNFLGIDSSYIPYAILNWMNPVVSVFFGYTGITMTKLTEEEYAKILEEREEEKKAALKALEA